MTEQSPIDERPSAVAALFVRHPLWEDALALLFGSLRCLIARRYDRA